MMAVMASATMVALFTSVPKAHLARIQEPPPWAAAIKQAVKGFISGIFIGILQRCDDLINPCGLNQYVVSQRVSGYAIPLSESTETGDSHEQHYPQERCHFTRSM